MLTGMLMWLLRPCPADAAMHDEDMAAAGWLLLLFAGVLVMVPMLPWRMQAWPCNAPHL
jgi:hypothetical protein